jgi:hypothetical protein
MTNFEPLREMASFTEDMFNRIIAFQEKEHAAWNTDLSFAERIQGLPLHNLIFSNPDRDPTQYRATVAAFYPLREEMQKIAHYVKQLASEPTVMDCYPGNGFIGSLLGREGVAVIGLHNDDSESLPNQIESFYDPAHFRYSNESVAQLQGTAALIAWPPSGVNPTPAFVAQQTPLLIYVYSDHVDETSQVRQTGSDDMLPTAEQGYRLIDSWQVERPQDVLHEIWPDMTPSIAETREVRIYAHDAVSELTSPSSLPPAAPYDWEKDLHMALLARQAKREIEARGIPL